MLRNPLPALVLGLLFALLPAAHLKADAASDLAKYSVFPQVDLSALSSGKIITARGPVSGFPRDLSIQAVYLLHAPLARALQLHKDWDPGHHSDLKVFLHHNIAGRPSLADFSLSLPGNSAVRKLADATGKLPAMDGLQLSKGEAAAFKGGDFRGFWSQLLLERCSAFLQRGLGGEPPYDSADGSARVSEEFARLVREQPGVRANFRPVIERSPLSGGTGSLPLQPYWELFDVEGEAAFSLGASCSVMSPDSAQMADIQYYASGGYYAYLTLYQMWPVTVSGKPATLVWRVDSISSLDLSDLSQFEKMGSGAAMMKDIQRIVSYFQRDVGR